jgi:cell division control protein 7
LTERASGDFEEEQQQHRRTDEMQEANEQWEMERPMSPQSYHSGDTDEYEMSHRPVLERTAIKKDIKRFVESVSCLKDPESGEVAYRVVDRLGEGELMLDPWTKMRY